LRFLTQPERGERESIAKGLSAFNAGLQGVAKKKKANAVAGLQEIAKKKSHPMWRMEEKRRRGGRIELSKSGVVRHIVGEKGGEEGVGEEVHTLYPLKPPY